MKYSELLKTKKMRRLIDMSKFGVGVQVKTFEVFGTDDEVKLNNFLSTVDVVDIQSSAYKSMNWPVVLHVLVAYRDVSLKQAIKDL